jgi:thiol-disulfide isomerase/thioredoxin
MTLVFRWGICLRDRSASCARLFRPCWPLAGLALVAALLVGACVPGQENESDEPRLTPTETEPSGPVIEFCVKDLEGAEVCLSEYRGRLVLVNFWATWCSPCREEMPILQAYYLDHKDQGFVVVGVNVSDRPQSAAEFVQEAGYSFPIWLDPPGNVLIDLRMQGLPASLLIDPQGHLLNRWIGPVTRDVLEAEIGPCLPVVG